MNDAIKILIGVLIGVILVGAAMMFAPSDAYDNSTDTNDSAPIVDQIQETVSDDTQADASVENTTSTVSTNANNNTGSQANNGNPVVVGGGSEFNAQEGNSDLYQINYSDGNFRQYDTKTGELIGSTFDEDQEKLGVVDGNLE